MRATVLGLVSLLITVHAFLITESTAQDIGEAYIKTIQQVQAEKYEEAIASCNQILTKWEPNGKGRKMFGPVFGHWYYLRGLSQMGLKQWDPAGESFEKCYDLTNDNIVTPDGNPVNWQPNQFRMHSLAQWGNIRMFVEDYAKARDLYRKALKEDKGNRLPIRQRIYIAVNLGRCLIKAGDVEEGYNYIVGVLDHEKASSQLKNTVFAILADDWSPKVSRAETLKFLDQYRHIPNSDTLEDRVNRNHKFHYLGGLALQNGDPLLALAWYRLVAHPGRQIAEHDHQIQLYEQRKQADKRPEVAQMADELIGELRDQQAKMREELWEMIATSGTCHFQLKNFSASYAAFALLSDVVPDHSRRPEFLHNAVVSAVQTDDWGAAYNHGKSFLAEFPKHQLKPAVVRYLVEIVFINGDYQEAYDIATEVRVDMEVGSEMRDIPDFIVGACAFQLGRPEEAEQELEAYLKNYSPAKREELARYFLGSSKMQMFKWQEGSDIFDSFLADFPGSAVTPSVLYQNGLCKFMLDDNEAAKPLVVRLLEKFPTAEEVPRGWNLWGDIASIEEASYEEVIRPSYLKGKETASQFPGQAEVAAYSLWQLLMNAASLEAWEESGSFFDELDRDHPDTAYRADALIGALPTLVALGRTDEALARQQKLLFEKGSDPTSGVAELFGTYLDFLKEHLPDELLQRMDDLSGSPDAGPTLQAWTRIGKIQQLEEQKGDQQSDINVQFFALDSRFNPEEQSNYVIVRLARWLTEERNDPERAATYYDYILKNRPGTEDYDFALLDRARIDAKSSAPEARERAMMYFDRVLNEFDNADLAEEASIGIARLLTQDKNWPAAQARWETYMDNRQWNRYSAEANFSYALCLDQQGQTSEALVVYINTYNAFPGHADWSTKAYLRSALIMKEKGEDLKALLILKDMLTRLKNIDHPNLDKGMQLFLKWRAEYVPKESNHDQ